MNPRCPEAASNKSCGQSAWRIQCEPKSVSMIHDQPGRSLQDREEASFALPEGHTTKATKPLVVATASPDMCGHAAAIPQNKHGIQDALSQPAIRAADNPHGGFN